MRESIVNGLPWLISATTILTMVLAGSVWRYTWLVALASQSVWLIWIAASETWGMIPGHAALWIVYIRNHVKWREQ